MPFKYRSNLGIIWERAGRVTIVGRDGWVSQMDSLTRKKEKLIFMVLYKHKHQVKCSRLISVKSVWCPSKPGRMAENPDNLRPRLQAKVHIRKSGHSYNKHGSCNVGKCGKSKVVRVLSDLSVACGYLHRSIIIHKYNNL